MLEHARSGSRIDGRCTCFFLSLSLFVFFKATGGRFILEQLVPALNGEVILMVEGESALVLRKQTSY